MAEETTLIIRDYLARQRTRMANERTLLSYIRTSLYFLVSGTALVKVEDLANISSLGYFSFAISIVLIIVGFFNFFRVRRKMRKGYYHKM
ncbi:DUF202 domain-containing protein [Litoribacter ruber]|uniref:DUF202 domain-containing protein n=1 Tax=Litoribacter ruber TaxID=702568 RepID=A0AAP2CHZ1_9BACT|nr:MULTISPECIES: DUF202 domain-containing protein [Litoribacter]MBS9525043.1 DUF202 domain-containing protein [Litoribacter alkaliphilus]MBT0811740.1 DUF202 domain-containing protein [Litoribacter ruber]